MAPVRYILAISLIAVHFPVAFFHVSGWIHRSPGSCQSCGELIKSFGSKEACLLAGIETTLIVGGIGHNVAFPACSAMSDSLIVKVTCIACTITDPLSQQAENKAGNNH